MDKNNHYKEELGGDILIIGGAEDKLNERHILRKFADLSGGINASILIVPIPSDFPLAAAALYKKIFEDLGIKKVNILEATTRNEILNIDAEHILNDVTGVFLTGGDQMRLSSLLGGTKFLQALKLALKKRGVTLAGSSAGASSMSSTMIVRGEPAVQPLKDSIRLCPGLGILKNIIIDQHFTERSRLSRLITAVSYNPNNLGIGIDENTAIHIKKNGILEVLGTGTVTIIDGSHITYNTIAEVHESEPFSVLGLQLNILSSSVRYDLYNRKQMTTMGKYPQI
ncbi:MAG: cyanophycinase [Ignavibacteriae bacterium]|nr:cyanophycinase [Ignavibacteriota bacterium]